MKKLFILFVLVFLSGYLEAATCFETMANGEKIYRQTTATKTLGTVANIKACAVQRFIIPYDNAFGMHLSMNPFPSDERNCYYLKVSGRFLQAYDATRINLDTSETYCPAI